MSTYCIGDLHGRYDLFRMLLEKIQFNPECDQVYVLGDVIDGDGKEGIKIIEYMMNHCDSMTLLRGNHEEAFLKMQSLYDVIMLDDEYRMSVDETVVKYSNMFYNLSRHMERDLPYHNSALLCSDLTIQKWLSNGNTGIRAKVLKSTLQLIEKINYDAEKLKALQEIFSDKYERLNLKNFFRELLLLSTEQYINLADFIQKTPFEYSLCIENRIFRLSHQIPYNETNKNINLKHLDTHNIYYIFGHDPVAKWHNSIWGKSVNGFNYNHREIFSYVDMSNNHYYNLDTNSNPIVALRLDDMSEYYVGMPSVKKDGSSWKIPNDKTEIIAFDYVITDEAVFNYTRKNEVKFSKGGRRGYVIITTKDNCYEYLIGVYKTKKQIIYTRIDWLDMEKNFVIQDWYNGQTDNEIIAKVHEDFFYRYQSEGLQRIDDFLCGKDG